MSVMFCIFCGEKAEYINNVFVLERWKPLDACGCAKCGRGFFLASHPDAPSELNFREIGPCWSVFKTMTRDHKPFALMSCYSFRDALINQLYGRKHVLHRLPGFCPTCGRTFKRWRNRFLRRKQYAQSKVVRYCFGCIRCNRSYLLFAKHPLDLREHPTAWREFRKKLDKR